MKKRQRNETYSLCLGSTYMCSVTHHGCKYS
uniref:Uncharacterized protein n=1 Tax=Rhizophora mucronata TaxID=61149 RepID=A0A2P2NID6_RHIMU